MLPWALLSGLVYALSHWLEGKRQPAVVVVFSGKRKSGKDYVTALLRQRLGGHVCEILRLSGPLKQQYAKTHGLDLEELMSASEYKERYRQKMIVWGEEMRNKDPAYFCRLATRTATRPVWIISDARRPSDLQYFQSRFNTLTVRVESSESTRASRGWEFTPGVDDVASECALDGRVWDVTIDNDGTDRLGVDLTALEKRIRESL